MCVQVEGGAGEGGRGGRHEEEVEHDDLEHPDVLEAVSALAPSRARRQHALMSKHADHWSSGVVVRDLALSLT